MASSLDPVQRLEAVEEIKRLKARYFRCLDAKDWDGFAAVFAPDAVMDMAEAAGGDPLPDATSRGPEDIAGYVRRSVEGMVTVHHGHMPEIRVTGETTAEGVWAMEDMLRWPDGREMHGYGHYHETYEKAEGTWRIKTLTLTRLRVDWTEPAGQ